MKPEVRMTYTYIQNAFYKILYTSWSLHLALNCPGSYIKEGNIISYKLHGTCNIKINQVCREAWLSLVRNKITSLP